MKYPLLAGILLLFACNASTSKNSTKSDSLYMVATYVNDLNTLIPVTGVVKRVTNYKIHYQGVDGDSVVRDTVYLVPTVDTMLVVMDSLKRPILDPSGHKQYRGSFRNPQAINKLFVAPSTITFPTAK